MFFYVTSILTSILGSDCFWRRWPPLTSIPLGSNYSSTEVIRAGFFFAIELFSARRVSSPDRRGAY